MNRREGIVTVLAACAAVVSGRAVAGGSGTLLAPSNSITISKMSFILDLDEIDHIEIRHGGETIFLVPAQIVEALKS